MCLRWFKAWECVWVYDRNEVLGSHYTVPAEVMGKCAQNHEDVLRMIDPEPSPFQLLLKRKFLPIT